MDDRRPRPSDATPDSAGAGPSTTVPDDLVDLLTTNRLGHVSAIRPDNSIAMYLMWIDWDGEHVLTSSPVGSRKGAHWRRHPHATLSVVDGTDPWRYLVIRGRVTAIRPDADLAFIDRMAQRYTGRPYHRRAPREIFEISPDSIRVRRGLGERPSAT